MNKLWWLAGLAVLLLLAVGGFYLRGQGELVSVVRVTQTELTQYIQATGKVKLKEERIHFAPSGGKLLRVHVKAGDVVEPNQLLAEMDPSHVEFQLEQLELQLEQVQADWNKLTEGAKPEELRILEEAVVQGELKLAAVTREWNKTKNDHDAGMAATIELQLKDEELRMAQSALVVASNNLALRKQGPSANDEAKFNARLKELQLQRDELVKDLQSMTIVASKGGTVMEVSAQEGQMVESGRKLLSIANPSEIEIESDVKDSLIAQVVVGQEAVISGPALGKQEYKARVIRMAPAASASIPGQEKKTARAVVLGIEGESDRLVPGYQVDVSFVTSRSPSTLSVPMGAVRKNEDGSSYVWTVQGSKAVRAPIEEGIRTETAVEVKKGLDANSLVIMRVPDTLRDQDKVEVARIGDD
jgi:HlyD family secretion protein